MSVNNPYPGTVRSHVQSTNLVCPRSAHLHEQSTLAQYLRTWTIRERASSSRANLFSPLRLSESTGSIRFHSDLRWPAWCPFVWAALAPQDIASGGRQLAWQRSQTFGAFPFIANLFRAAESRLTGRQGCLRLESPGFAREGGVGILAAEMTDWNFQRTMQHHHNAAGLLALITGHCPLASRPLSLYELGHHHLAHGRVCVSRAGRVADRADHQLAAERWMPSFFMRE